MRRVEASAPGKVILFGEHFVVRGYRALATAIGLRARVIVEESRGGSIRFISPNLKLEESISLNLENPIHREFEVYTAILRSLKSRGYTIIPHNVIIDSDIPLSAGLGSSASTSVAYTLAYTTLHDSPLREDELLEVSLEGEKIAHGKPSGIDVNIAVSGGTIVYKRGEKPIRIADVNIPRGYSLLIIDSGIKRSTRDAVEYVLRLSGDYWSIMEYIYRAADAIIDDAIEALRAGDMRRLSTLMNINHGLLSSIGVSRLELDMIVNSLRESGALGAKLTGAGWGGCVIAIIEDNIIDSITSRLLKYKVYRTLINASGARVDYSTL
ncbi:MAG: mevalonate kinase [Acidilobaceae archaeon]